MKKKKDIDLLLSKLDISPDLDKINSKCNISIGKNVRNKMFIFRPIYLSFSIIIILLCITIVSIYSINKNSLDNPNNNTITVASTEYEVVDTIFNDEVEVGPNMKVDSDNNMNIAIVEIGKDISGNVLYTNKQYEAVEKVFIESNSTYKILCESGIIVKYDKISGEWEVIK